MILFSFFYFIKSDVQISYQNTVCNIDGDGIVYQETYRNSGPYSSYITLNIGSEITELTSSCFAQSTSLTTVNFASNSHLTTVGSYAFNECSNLIEVKFPDSVTYIGEFVFRGCYPLSNVIIGENVEFIGIPVHYNSDHFKKFTVADGNQFYSTDGNALYNKNKTILYQVASGCDPNYKIPDGVIEIFNHSLHGLKSVQIIYVPKSVEILNAEICSYNYYSISMVFEEGISIKQFPANVFFQWINLEYIVLPESITSIPPNAFTGCSYLNTITIPKSVSSIDSSAFTQCSSLKTINIMEGNENFKTVGGAAIFSSDLTELLILPTSVTTLSIPSSCTSIPSTALQLALNLVSISIEGDNPKFQTDGKLIYQNNYKDLYYCVGGVSEVNVTLNTETIQQYAFLEQSHIKEIDLSHTKIHLIDAYAFHKSTSLETVILPNTIQNINSFCFGECSNLANVQFQEDNINKIYLATRAFYKCNKLTSISFPSNLTQFGDYTFTESSLQSVNFSKNSIISEIPQFCFYLCDDLQSIVLPDSITLVRTQAFGMCTSLQSIAFGSGLNSIDSYAFSSCTKLDSIIFSEQTQLETISTAAFSQCSSLTSFTIPDSVTKIDASVFQQCTNLIEIKASTNSNFSTSDGILYSKNSEILILCPCGKETATISSHIKNIGDNSFYGCQKLKTLVFEADSSLESIGKNTFFECIALENVSFPDSLETIEEGAFEGCTNLEILEFGDNGQIQTIGASTFHGCEKLKTIHLPKNGVLTEISAASFEDCKNLEEITIPKSVETLCEGCFRGCSKLTNVIFHNDEVKSNDEDSSSQLITIESEAFKDCSSLTEINLPNALLSSIGSSSFSGTSLISIIIPSSVQTLESKCFYGVSTLKNITLNNDLETIGEECFSGCSFKSIALPTSLTTISNYAFQNCKNLRHVFYCGSNSFETNNNAFNGCNKFIDINVRKNYTYPTFCGISVTRTLTEDCIYVPIPPTIFNMEYSEISVIQLSIAIILLTSTKSYSFSETI